MLSTLLADNLWLSRIAILLVLGGAVAVAAVLVRQEGALRLRVSWIIAGLGLVGSLALTLTPDGPPTAPAACNFQPSEFYRDVPNLALLFVPALFGSLVIRRPWLMLAAAALLPAGIELVQGFAGIGRRCDVDDWLTNVIGGAAGVAVGALLVARARSPRRSTRGTGGDGPGHPIAEG